MKKLFILSVIVPFVVACSGKPSERSMLPDSGETTLNVYESHISGKVGKPYDMNESGHDETLIINGAQSRIAEDYEIRNRYTNIQIHDLASDFRRIENPEIIGYVYPHLSPNNYPIAGYFTMFPLYESAGYALSFDEGIVR